MRGDLSTFLRACIAYAFFFDLIFAYAIYTAYFEIKGLTYNEIGLLLAIWSGAALLFEIFSGALSDWLDRRWVLFSAPLVKILTFILWALADGNFWLYALGFISWSLAGAFYSGTMEALLFERLEAQKKQSEFDRHFGQVNAAESLGIGFGLLFGGFFAAYFGMPATLWLAIPPLVLAAIAALFLIDMRSKHDALRMPGFWINIRLAFVEAWSQAELRFVILYISAGLIIFEQLEEFDQLYYRAVNLPLWLFGIVGAAGMVLYSIGSLLAHRLAGYKMLAWLLPAFGGFLFIAASFGWNPWFVIVLELAYIVAIPATILAEARVQMLITTQARATTTSLVSFLQNVFAIAIALIFGWIATHTGILTAYGWAGIALIGVSFWVWANYRRGTTAF